jgi:hypothetical protein
VFPVFFAALVIGVTFAFSLWSAEPDEPKGGTASPQQSELESNEVRLARAHVRLAKLDVERALEANRKTPNLYPPEFIELLKLHVEIDESDLERSLKHQDVDSRETLIRNAEASLRIARMNVIASKAVFGRLPSVNSKYDVETAKVNLEIAELELEQAKRLQSSDPLEVIRQLHRQISQLRHQIMQMKMNH